MAGRQPHRRRDAPIKLSVATMPIDLTTGIVALAVSE
jgi:hypothetical protein